MVNILPNLVISMSRHAFVESALLQPQHHFYRFVMGQPQICSANQCGCRKRINSALSHHLLNRKQSVMGLLFLHAVNIT